MKIKIILAALLAAFLIPFGNTHADESATSISTLSELTTYAAIPGNYRLDADITISANLSLADGVSLDLNNHTLSCGGKTVLVGASKTVTIKDDSATKGGKITGTSRTIQVTGQLNLESGTVQGVGGYAIYVASGGVANINGGLVTSNYWTIVNFGTTVINGGSVVGTGTKSTINCQKNALLTLESGLIKAEGDIYAVQLAKAGAKFTMNGGEISADYENLSDSKNGGIGVAGFKDTEIIINGGYIHSHAQAIYGNGTNDGGGSDGSNMKVTITGGNIETKLASIYIPQYNGETTISGGTVTSEDTVIEIRAGKLTITGGTFTGGSDPWRIESNSSGSTVYNAGVSVIQHTTKAPIEVLICGGTFNANMPFIEANPEGNAREYIDQISLAIGGDTCNGGTPVFNTTGGGEDTVYSQDFDKFIYAGRYTNSVEKYIAEKHGEIDENGMKAVYALREITVEQPAEGGIVEVDKEETLRGMLVTIKLKPASGYIVKSITVYDENGNQIPVTNNQFYAPDSDTRVVVEFTVDNPATVDNSTDYGAFMAICIAALACSISSIALSRKLV